VKTKRWATFIPASIIVGLSLCWYLNVYCKTDAPVSTALTRWEAVLQIVEDKPVVRVEMSGHVFKATRDAPTAIPVIPREMVFKNLRLNGKPATPVRTNDWFAVERDRPGEFTVSAELEIKPDYDRGEHRLTIRRPPFVEALLVLDSDTAWDVRIEGIVGKVVGNEASGTHGSLALGEKCEFTVRWQEPRPEVVRVGSSSVVPSVVWTVGERVVSANALLTISAVGGPVSEISLRPGGKADNVRVHGGDVKDFRLSDDQLDVYFSKPIKGTTRIELSYNLPRPKGDLVKCLQLDPCDGRIDAGGWMMVVNDSDGILLEHDTTGLQPVSDLDMPQDLMGLVSGKPVFFYECTARDVSLVLDVVSSVPFPVVDTIADRADILCVVRPGGEEITRISYRIKNNGKQFLRMALPEDVTLLKAEVENKPCRVGRDGKDLLIPLVKSIQTLGGLVSFPVEIVYCRQGDRATPRDTRRLDLPELDGIPVAVVNATVMCPSGTVLRSYTSALRHVDGFTHERREVNYERVDHLGYNYYQAGYDAYRKNDLEEAEQYLGKAAELMKDTSYAEDAMNLSSNIRIGRGDVDENADRMERAKVATIQEGLKGGNQMIAQSQEVMIETGLANIAEGDEELGLELLEEAQSLGKKLVQRGESSRRQTSLNRQYEGELKKVKAEQEANKKLNEQLKSLQYEAAELVQSDSGPQQGDRGQVFTEALYNAAKDEGLTMVDAQNAAFGSQGRIAGNEEPIRVTKAAEARKHQKNVSLRRADKVSQKSKATRSTRGSIAKENLWLSKKVKALEKAVDWANSAPAQPSGPPVNATVTDDSLIVLNTQAKQAEDEVQQLMAAISVTNVTGVVMNDITVTNRLAELETWSDNNLRTVGQFDDSTRYQFASLKKSIKRARATAKQKEQMRLAATNIVIDVSDVLDDKGRSGQNALGKFIGSNYVAPVTNGMSQFNIENGQLNVLNAGRNPDILNDVVYNLLANDGQVVTVAGRTLTSDAITNLVEAVDWFSNTTADGKQYAVLDEAQYRTLANASVMASPSTAEQQRDQRDVIVGTPNRVAGQDLKLESSDDFGNGLQIGGTPIVLPHEQYLVVNNGAELSVIKAGAVRGWQEDAEEVVELEVEAPFEVELPSMGIAFRFEKTLLSAGESPDIEMEL
jgi:hypothetical protein